MRFRDLSESDKEGWKKIIGNIYLNVKGVNEHLKYDEFLLDTILQTLEEIIKNNVNKPRESVIRKALIWSREVGHGDITYKSGGGSMSDTNYESQLVVDTVARNGNDKRLIILKGTVSNNIEDVYIHKVNIDEIERILKGSLSKKVSWRILKDKILSYINVSEIAISRGIKISGKFTKFKNIDEVFNVIFKNSEDLYPGVTQNKSKVISYLNELLSRLERGWKLFDEPELRKEIINYLLKNI